MNELQALLKKTNINFIQLIDCEADDLIASFIQKNSLNTSTIFDIFTRDKDLLQLLDKNVNILKYIDGKATLYTVESFQKEYNFRPDNYVDYLSLLGDNVDNIEGVKGIGPISAKKLIQQFQTVENIYQQINKLPEITKHLLVEKEKLV